MSGAIAVTIFRDRFASAKAEQLVCLSALAHLIEFTGAPAKHRLPLLKLARFGDRRTGKNCLRWDGNMLAISGVEGDYDAGQFGFDRAVEIIGAAGVCAIICTSPSYCADAPRWRVLAPLSQEYPPAQRDAFLARLNGLFRGSFAGESWTKSQSYYFGSVNRNPSHRVVLLRGTPIDQMIELDAVAIGKTVKVEATTERPVYPVSDPSLIAAARIAGKVQSLLDNVRRAPDGAKRRLLISNGRALGGYLSLAQWSKERAVEELIQALPDTVADWDAARSAAAWAVNEGAKRPLVLADRPYPGNAGGRSA